MMPRLWTPRLNYMSFSVAGDTAKYLKRWRLEKHNPGTAASDVANPVVYVIDPSVPARWIPWVTRGVGDWLPLFDAIGFRHALRVQRASTIPATSVERREVLIRWQADTSTGDTGAETTFEQVDSTTGEILHATITFNGASIARSAAEAFVATGATDPRARYPYPDSVLGPYVQMLVAHEVGHSLGLDHRFNRHAAYSIDSIRRAAFVHRMGFTSSVMGYQFFHYVAQPEDHIAPGDLHMRVGPYDAFALAWGYRPIPEARTPADEWPTLTRWLDAQDTAAYLRGAQEGEDAGIVGDDPLRAAEDGLRNMARVTTLLSTRGYTRAIRDSSVEPFLRKMLTARWAILVIQPLSVLQDMLTDDHGGNTSNGGGAVSTANAGSAGRSDSARAVQVLHFVLVRAFYGDDPVLRHNVLVDTTSAPKGGIVLFMATRSGWDAQKWSANQGRILTTVIDAINAVHAASATSPRARAMLPGLCEELQSLSLDLALLPEHNERMTEQKWTFRGILDKVLHGSQAACSE